MSARPHAATVVRLPADGGVSPNAVVPQITVDLRVFWTHASDWEAVQGAMSDALLDVVRQMIAQGMAPPDLEPAL